MLRLGNLTSTNLYTRRTLRALYAQTQGYPYDAQLDPNFSRTAGALSGGTAISGAQSAILPGLVATKEAGEVVTPSTTWAESARPFGLFANFVGGTITDITNDQDTVGIWRGVGSVYEILAPAFSSTNLSTDAANENGTGNLEVYLASNSKAQLQDVGAGAYVVNTAARLLNYLSSSAIIVELLV